MQKRSVLGIVLASSVALAALAGCNTPMPGGMSPETGATATTDRKATTAEALAEEQEMDDYDTIAAQEAAAGRYEVFAVGGPKAREGEVAITSETKTKVAQERKAAFKAKLDAKVSEKLKDRLKQKVEKVKGRLDKMKGAADKIKNQAKNAPWVDNGDGTETKTIKFEVTKSVNAQGATRSVEMTRTRNKETKDLVSSEVKFSMTMPNGMSRNSTRTKTLNADGSYTVVFHGEFTFKDGTKRVADWTKTIAVDGSVTGTGTIVWTDASGKETKKVEVSLNGTDEETKATTEGEVVTPAPAEPEASASPAPSASPSASPSPEASASPEASPSPEASASPEAEATAEVAATASN